MWKERVASLRELREEYTYEDALKANSVLDMYADIEAAMETMAEMERPKSKGALE